MNATRDAMAHRFVAYTLDETAAWPASTQAMFHDLVFSTLPEIILELDAPAACRFARGWRTRIDASDVVRETIEAVPVEAPPSVSEVSRLAELLRRFGPLALALPWRDRAPVKA